MLFLPNRFHTVKLNTDKNRVRAQGPLSPRSQTFSSSVSNHIKRKDASQLNWIVLLLGFEFFIFFSYIFL